jgi:hypothetical protein
MMNEVLEAPGQKTRTSSEEPEIYQSGDCWRFRWAGEDHGSFDSEQGAKSASQRFKKHAALQRAAASLNRH